MSDFDRNIAARGGFADRAAIDAGLRAHMIRVYNYMATAVALTGVVAWLYFPERCRDDTIAGADCRPDAVRPGHPQRLHAADPDAGTLGLVFFISFRIHSLAIHARRSRCSSSTPRCSASR